VESKEENTKLPVLLSIPHGGKDVPAELSSQVAIDSVDLFDDSDSYTREIYDLGGSVRYVVKADIARAFVDLNRASDDLPPENPDGVVKTATCYGRPIYKEEFRWTSDGVRRLLDNHYYPYHRELERALEDSRLVLALDCHSMAAVAPPVSAIPGLPRPLFCLSNRSGESASDDTVSRLAACIVEAFELEPEDVLLNDPFMGGHITASHGGGRVPWVQVEMSRALYLVEPWFDRENLEVDRDRIEELNRRFRNALFAFCRSG